MTEEQIVREQEVHPDLIPPLNNEAFRPSDAELDFLHAAISIDKNELRRRIFEVQKE